MCLAPALIRWRKSANRGCETRSRPSRPGLSNAFPVGPIEKGSIPPFRNGDTDGLDWSPGSPVAWHSQTRHPVQLAARQQKRVGVKTRGALLLERITLRVEQA